MATTATITRNGKTVRAQMSIEQKARLLQVVDYEPGVLAVRSGSDPRIAYAVKHENFQVTSCACTGCKVHGRTHCAYRLAAENKLAEMRRIYHIDLFQLYQF